MDLLELMKNDLTNYQISQNRAAIEEYSAKKEYEMFQKTLEENPNGCNFTRAWLKTAYDELFKEEDVDSEEGGRKRKKEESEDVMMDTTSRGYVNLVQKDEYPGFPESLSIDRIKIELLAEKFLQIVICASAVFVTCNVAGRRISESPEFKKTLKDHLVAITNQTDQEKIQGDLERIGEQCVRETEEAGIKCHVEVTEDQKTSIRNQIQALIGEENPIRSLVHRRVSTFVEEMLRSPTSVPHRLLPGLSVIQSELCAFTSKFLRLCVHNRKTFYTLYSSLCLEFQGHAPSTHAVYRPDSPSSMPGPSEPGPSSS
uniref:Interferon-induced very large GTPase 1-like n=1 Tax=Caenorhabditis tropicalis TaxID=1561998 RepID=A0A1I7V101_9PELO